LFVTHIFILLILVSGVQGDGWLLQIGAEIQTAGQGIFFLTQLICHLMSIKFHLIVPVLVNGLLYIEG
jgi:hypothetical protein